MSTKNGNYMRPHAGLWSATKRSSKTMSNSLIGSGGKIMTRGIVMVMMNELNALCACVMILHPWISPHRLLMLVDIQSHCPLLIVMGLLTPSPLTCISGSSVVFHTRPSKETVAWHISMWIWLNMNDSVGRGHQLGLAVSMFLEWLGEGILVEHNTAQYMPCTLIECKKCKSPLSN